MPIRNSAAPWSTSLIVISSLATAICFGVAISFGESGRPWVAILPVVIVCGCALFIVRGYTVTRDTILIQRLFWATRIPLAGFQLAEIEPGAMRWSIRLFGIGGLFSFCGWFYNKALGAYRAFVTDPHRAVVLRFATRNVVLSPAAPEDFVRQLQTVTQPA
jgi:hypothetical protein